jgi:hypothetical protein
MSTGERHLRMKNLGYVLMIGVLLPGCDKVGNLGEHASDSAGSGDGGESGGGPQLCQSEEDCDPGQACDHTECHSNCPEDGQACPDVCYGECVGGSGSGTGSGTGGDEGGGACESCPDPAPGAPNYLCPDGTVAGPACLPDAAGVCGWQLVECPAYECTEEECGPAPGAPNFDCEDGTIGGPGPCQQLDDGTCGYPWIDCPPCCDGTMAPDCPLSECCDDGTWSCSGCAAPGIECGVGQCVDDGASCAAGETCCAGLQCCAGVPVPPGDEYCGLECPMSDRNKKENFAVVDPEAVLEKVTQLPIFTWNYNFEDPSIRHLGPMAQDFKASFEVGASDKSIFVVDADGVALAAIQALDAQVKTLEAENAKLTGTIEAFEKRLRELEHRR